MSLSNAGDYCSNGESVISKNVDIKSVGQLYYETICLPGQCSS